MTKNGTERCYTKRGRGRQGRDSQIRGTMARMKEKLGEERRLRKEKTEEKFEVKAKNKDKEMDIMILDGED